MNLHPSVHLDIAREREQALDARAQHRILVQRALCREARGTDQPSSGPPGAAELSRTPFEAVTSAAFRELAHRIDGGIDVTLLWSSREDRLAVAVFDERADEWFVLDAERDNALDVFYHPYAHALLGRAA